MIEQQFARTREKSRHGRQLVGQYWSPRLEIDFLIYVFRNRNGLLGVLR